MCNLIKTVKKSELKLKLGGDYNVPVLGDDVEELLNSFDRPEMPVILSNDPKTVVRWPWDFTPPGSQFNALATRHARSETMFDSKLYGDSARERRCLILAQGFYEFGPKKKGKTTKTPYYIERVDGDIIAMGGIWKDWGLIGGHPYRSMVIATTEPNALLADIIAIPEARMTYHVQRSDWDKWLDPSTPIEEVKQMIHTCPDGVLKAKELDESPLKRAKPVTAKPPKIEPNSLF